jgi:DNA replication and repair protein RecF
VLVVSVSVRNFRCYSHETASFGPGLTVITGVNGAGKTNLLEAVYFGCTGRSCRTNNEREVVRFGQPATRVVVTTRGEEGSHELAVGFAPGEAKRLRVDGAPVERLGEAGERPLVSVFLPDRIELVKGPPGLRRPHLDQFVSALWPRRAVTRRAYAQALAQRNALIVRIRARGSDRGSLHSWDAQLARYGIELMEDRRAATAEIAPLFSRWCEDLGLDGSLQLAYRPRSSATSAEALAAELRDRIDGDIERGFTGHGPHRDDLAISRDGRALRAYGSQGQQRMALLALLLAERDALARHRSAPPLMLLDDVMSELDTDRRRALVHLLRTGPGQALVTATELDGVPGGDEPEVGHLEVVDGRVLARAGALT